MEQPPTRRSGAVFVLTLWLCLGLVWLVSGEQLLDLVFGLPDIGPLDDIAITVTVWAEDLRATLGWPDLFADLRAAVHGMTGLGQTH